MSSILLMFAIKHWVCDWVFQTNWMAQGKAQDKLEDWFYPLFIHSTINAIGTFFVVCWAVYFINNHDFDSFMLHKLILIAPAVDLLTHMVIDKSKMYLNKKYSLTVADSWFWNLIGFDQLMHFTIYCGIIAYIELIIIGG